jgi:pimeloyl-CoA synthetase
MFRSVGDFIEVTQISGGPRYIRKDDIYMVGSTLHRVLIYIKGRSDYEAVCFANLQNQEQVIQELLLEISHRPAEIHLENNKNNSSDSFKEQIKDIVVSKNQRRTRDDFCNMFIMFILICLLILAGISLQKNFNIQ